MIIPPALRGSSVPTLDQEASNVTLVQRDLEVMVLIVQTSMRQGFVFQI